jgi:8-oxo-dGTP diphosphatase
MSASLVSLASLLDGFEPVMPQVRVAAVILRQEQLLLIEHKKDGQRYWVLPGGRLQAGETLKAALQRELREELSLTAQIDRLLAVFETLAPQRHTVNLAFVAEVGRQEPQIDRSDPVLSGWQWVDLDRLRRLDFRPPIAPLLAEMVGEGLQGPVRLLGDTWTAAPR